MQFIFASLTTDTQIHCILDLRLKPTKCVKQTEPMKAALFKIIIINILKWRNDRIS